jgi:hypothetical protein
MQNWRILTSNYAGIINFSLLAITLSLKKAIGFNARLQEGGPGRIPVEEVLAGHAQYAEANSELLCAKLKGNPW